MSIRLQSGWGPFPDSGLCNFHLLCPWYVDALNRILNATPRRVLVLDGHGVPGRYQNHFIAHLDYDGVWGTFRANTASVGELETIAEVNGDDGDIAANLLTGEVRFRSRWNSDWVAEHWPALRPQASWPGMHESVGAFLDAVESGEQSRTGAQTVTGLHLVGLAGELSKDSGAWVEVEETVSIDDAEATGVLGSSTNAEGLGSMTQWVDNAAG